LEDLSTNLGRKGREYFKKALKKVDGIGWRGLD